MTNKELLEKKMKKMEHCKNECERRDISVNERIPYILMILKLHHEIVSIESMIENE